MPSCLPACCGQIKGTVLLMPNGSDRITVAPEQAVSSDKKVEDPELLALLASSLKPRKPSKKKSGAKAAAAAAVEGARRAGVVVQGAPAAGSVQRWPCDVLLTGRPLQAWWLDKSSQQQRGRACCSSWLCAGTGCAQGCGGSAGGKGSKALVALWLVLCFAAAAAAGTAEQQAHCGCAGGVAHAVVNGRMHGQ